MLTTIPERFWSKVDQTGGKDACWPWLGRIEHHGYGRFTLPGSRQDSRRVYAHRFAYEVATATAIPKGLTIDHLCRVRECVNPAHLEPVTMIENLRRSPRFKGGGTGSRRVPLGYPAPEKGLPLPWPHANTRKTHCIHGHLFDEANTERRKNGNRNCRACARARRLRRSAA